MRANDKIQRTRPQPKMTQPVQAVLRAFLNAPDEEHFGLDLIATTGMLSGTLYPILSRLEDAGWLESRLVDVHYSDLGRRARRYFRLTETGSQQAADALNKVQERVQAEQARSRTRLLAEAQPS